MRRTLLACLTLLIATSAPAGLSKAATSWRQGPEMFLLTDAEKKEWKKVTSDAEAAAFIDLFWARRDPTPGTAENEFRDEFLRRVRYADAAFSEKRTRGALTERGQVYIVLGPPQEGTRETMSISQPAGMSQASARSADSVVWTWPREVAVSLGVPRIVVTFNQIAGTDRFVRNTKGGQFSNVSKRAVETYVVASEITALPDWALRTGAQTVGLTAPEAQ